MAPFQPTETNIPAPRLTPSRRGMRDVEQDRAAALEAERTELVQAIMMMDQYVGYRVALFTLASAMQPAS